LQHLFSDHFLATIGALSVELRSAPPRVAHGAHLSPRSGASLEFRDYQGYTSGDDLRRIDWNVYARTRHLFIRRFEHPTAIPIFMLVDASESMRLETPSRYATAARIAAAVASAGLTTQNPVRVTIADGAAIAVPKSVNGRRGLVRILGELAADRVTGGQGVTAALDALRPVLVSAGRGVLVIISDFFEQQGVQTLIESLSSVQLRVVLIRITQPWDSNPILNGDFELEDCESDSRVRISTSDDAIGRYREAYQSYFAALDQYVALRGSKQIIIDASAETLPQLATLFPNGVLNL
jgi:uncharacterized protein (DUF58 family)